jgi:hypothetical protein
LNKGFLVMSLQDVFDNGQPEARAAMLTRPALVDSEKTLKHTRNVFSLDPHAVILNLDQLPVDRM